MSGVKEELEGDVDEATMANLAFCKKHTEELHAATKYKLVINAKRGIAVNCEILGENVHITEDPLEMPEGTPDKIWTLSTR